MPGNRPVTAAPSKRNADKASQERESVLAALNKEKIWVDRWARELKGQREWSTKWGALNDPTLLYPDDSLNTRKKNPPTQWSGFSVINPPGRKPLPSKPEVPAGLTPPTFKITGDRTNQRSRKPSSSQYPWDNRHTERTTSSSAYGAAYRQSSPQSKHQTVTHSSPKPVTPAFHKAPFATSTPVSAEDVKAMERAHRATIIMYNSSLVGARAAGKVDFARDPQTVYKVPVTSSMEYGWNWAGRKTLEIYGR